MLTMGKSKVRKRMLPFAKSWVCTAAFEYAKAKTRAGKLSMYRCSEGKWFRLSFLGNLNKVHGTWKLAEGVGMRFSGCMGS